MDQGISKTKNLWESHWAHSSTTHGSNLKLLQSWWAGKNKHLFDYYLAYTKPFQHWSLKNPADNPYIRELDFQEKEEIFSPLKVNYFIQLLNNLKENKEGVEIEPEGMEEGGAVKLTEQSVEFMPGTDIGMMLDDLSDLKKKAQMMS